MTYFAEFENQGNMSQIGVKCHTNEYHTSTEALTTAEPAATEAETQASVSGARDQSSGDESSGVNAGVFTGRHHAISQL